MYLQNNKIYYWYGVIYKITNIQSNKCYIGKTSAIDYVNYINTHFKNALTHKDITIDKKEGKYLYNSIRKYKKENFKIKILGYCFSLEELNESEIEAIWLYRSFGSDGENEDSIYGYNRTKGGDGGKLTSIPTQELMIKKYGLEETKRRKNLAIEKYKITMENKTEEEKISIAHKQSLAKKGKKQSKEHRENISNASKNKIPWNKGIKTGPRPKEVIDKIVKSKKNNNFHHSAETKEILRIKSLGNLNNLGKKRTEETKQKLRDSHQGPKPWLKGKKKKPITEETRKKLKEVHKGSKGCNAKKFLVISPIGEEIYLHGEFSRFCRENKLSFTLLKQVAKGERDNYKGWKCIEVRE